MTRMDYHDYIDDKTEVILFMTDYTNFDGYPADSIWKFNNANMYNLYPTILKVAREYGVQDLRLYSRDDNFTKNPIEKHHMEFAQALAKKNPIWQDMIRESIDPIQAKLIEAAEKQEMDDEYPFPDHEASYEIDESEYSEEEEYIEEGEADSPEESEEQAESPEDVEDSE